MRHPSASTALLIVPVLLALAQVPAGAEIFEERIRGNLIPIQYGPGTTRLDAMGLSIAARDENSEINLFDFGGNPAGLLEDRDAWSADIRFAHRERVERNPDLPGFDFRGNSYSFLAAYRNPGVQALAGGYDYYESKVAERGVTPTDFENSLYRVMYNRQIGVVNLGAEFRYGAESEDLLNPTEFYYIEHKTDSFTGTLGLSYKVHQYFTVAGLGNLSNTTVSGQSSSDAHQDEFDWDRPSGTAQAQVFVHHPRVTGAAIYGRAESSGEEIATYGWSPLFVYNPSNRYVTFEETTFTEKRDLDEIRTRWDVRVIPDLFSVSASWYDQTSTNEILNIPTVLGSRQPIQDQWDASDVAVGGSLYLLNQRLFVGSEIHHQEQTYSYIDETEPWGRQLKLTSLSFGSEYLVLENLAARGGLGFRSEERWDTSPGSGLGPEGVTESSTTASVGVGLVPSGGILQLDAAYNVDLSSGWDIDQNNFSLYARLLF